ncbi:MAG: hypothetical protein ACREU4_02440 [Burkholderiales bacterium]
MSAELEVLQDAIARLEGAGIAYMLTGSVALSYYAEPRMTRDVDLVVELADRDPRSIVALFAPDYYVSEADAGRAISARTMFNVLHLGKLVKLDLIVRKDTAYRRREFGRRKRVPMPGFEAWIVSREDLILSKLAWAKESGSGLRDTTPEFRRLMRERFLALAPEERVQMCADMFETARRVVEASLPEGLDAQERRYQICRRFYGDLADRAFGRRYSTFR